MPSDSFHATEPIFSDGQQGLSTRVQSKQCCSTIVFLGGGNLVDQKLKKCIRLLFDWMKSLGANYGAVWFMYHWMNEAAIKPWNERIKEQVNVTQIFISLTFIQLLNCENWWVLGFSKWIFRVSNSITTDIIFAYVCTTTHM